MKKLWPILLFCLLYPALPPVVIGAESKDDKVYVIPIRDDIMPPVLYVVRRGIKGAIAAGATTVIIDMETNGGRVDTTEELIEILDRFEGKKVTYVNKKAFSAGAFVSVATEAIYMAPGAVIGAAAPILMVPGGTGADAVPDTMEVKMTSGISALVRANAERYGHNVDVIEAMIDKTKELKIDDEVLCEKGQILTLTNTEAEKKYGADEKPLLSAGTVVTLNDLVAQLGLEHAEIVRVEPTGTEQIGAWINRISPILLMIGIIGLYIEFKTPGFGLPGIVGLAAFVIYFFGGYIAGLSSIGWGALFVLGLLLLVIEILLIPGTMIAGLVGALMMLGAIVMALVDWEPTLPAYTLPTLAQFTDSFQVLSLALIGVAILLLLLGKHFPNTGFYSQMVSQSASGVETENRAGAEKDSRLGLHGVVVSPLRPGGKAHFGDDVLDVVSQGEMIDSGTEVKIIDFSGRDAVVVSIF
ncbi:MAG: hypothetical protein M2R45_03615 [Verrucomicrobia subdivision 3 bacterium]|nr:hypothetical protein [Limisphaerales bacterium]MCS1416890.1 hypothetical protein [Limisphaerales bacterium]